MVKIVSFYLEGTSSMRWKSVKDERNNIRLPWEDILVRLRTRFYFLQRRKGGEFLTLSHDKMYVLQYTAKFMELSRFAPDFLKTIR